MKRESQKSTGRYIAMNPIECDEFEMDILSTNYRDKYTRLGRILLVGMDGVNYGLNEYGTWTSSSFYPRLLPSHLGLPFDHSKFFHFNNIGRKYINWKSQEGKIISLQKISFYSALHSAQFNKDLPKEVTFIFKKKGKITKEIKYVFRKYENLANMTLIDTIQLCHEKVIIKLFNEQMKLKTALFQLINSNVCLKDTNELGKMNAYIPSLSQEIEEEKIMKLTQKNREQEKEIRRLRNESEEMKKQILEMKFQNEGLKKNYLDHIEEFHTTKYEIIEESIKSKSKSKDCRIMNNEDGKLIIFESDINRIEFSFTFGLLANDTKLDGKIDFKDLRITRNEEEIEIKEEDIKPRSFSFEIEFKDVGESEITIEFKNVKRRILFSVQDIIPSSEHSEISLRGNDNETKVSFSKNEEISVFLKIKNSKNLDIPRKYFENDFDEIVMKIKNSTSKNKHVDGILKKRIFNFENIFKFIKNRGGENLFFVTSFKAEDIEDGKYEISGRVDDFVVKTDFEITSCE